MQEGHILNDDEMTLKKFNHILKLARYPKSIFEIGFNGGHSARMWLEFYKDDPDFRLHSVDICNHEYTEVIAKELEEKDPRFTFTKMSSFDLEVEQMQGYELLFVDGDHSAEGIRNDILLGNYSKIPYILIDDYKHRGHHHQIGDTADSIIGNLNFPYCWFGKKLHYNATDGINRMRLAMRISKCRSYGAEMQEMFKKT